MTIEFGHGQEPRVSGAIGRDVPARIVDAALTARQTLEQIAVPDLTLCDLEAITRLEKIQSFGFLLGVSRDWIVTRASSNLLDVIDISARLALGMTLDDIVDRRALHDIRNQLSGLAASGGIERLYAVSLITGRAPVDLAIHYAGDTCVIEGEAAGLDNSIDAASLVRKMIMRLNSQASLDGLHRDAARQVRTLTGFDRVMIYRFSPDGSGEVVAESLKSGMQGFIGLHYPASDIPVQARALYLRNPFRVIADVNAETVSLLSVERAAPLDLTMSLTRAVSPVHIEYLRNMGVGASLSISIIVQGKLWGLIACHHGSARLPTFVIRTAAELFGQLYSMTLEARLSRSSEHKDLHTRESVAKLVTSTKNDPSLLHDAGWLQDIMREMIPCDGLAVSMHGRASRSGSTPPESEIEAIAQILADVSPSEVASTDDLGSLRSDKVIRSEAAAGLMWIPVAPNAADFLLLFRRELRFDIQWAGASGKAAFGSERLSPRKSFDAFTESVRGRSRPFPETERRVAQAIRSGLIEVLLREALSSEAERNQSNSSQELLIAELNHRVRNVLALIRGLISQTRGEGGDSASYVASLGGRVQALARAHDRVTRQKWGPGPLNDIFEDEIAAYVPTSRHRFTITGSSIFLQPQAYSTFALIIHELVTNSCKYGSLSDSGRVEVTLSIEAGKGLTFDWRERGGPSVALPTRRGFGSIIIERVVPFDLQGTALVSYAPAGLEASFFIPERYLAVAAQDRVHVAESFDKANLPAPVSLRPLEGLQVLILEDNLIVALAAEEILQALGAASIKAVSSSEAAQAVCAAQRIEFALLDINLGFETSFGFAAMLRSQNIPFIFASGYSDDNKLSAELTVSKPYDHDGVCAAVTATLEKHRAATTAE